jgi:hypothetical protein
MRRCVGLLRVTQLLRPARGQRFPKGPAAGSAEMCMRRRVASTDCARPVVPVGPTAGGAASNSAVQLRRGPRAAHGPSPSWACSRWCPAEHARYLSSGVANGIVNQVGPSSTAHGSSKPVKAHTPCRGRPSCRNTGFKLHGAAVMASLPHSCAAGCCVYLVEAGLVQRRWPALTRRRGQQYSAGDPKW